MDRSERFYKIIQILKNRQQANLQYFLDQLEISRATFNRDLEYLRDRFNAPIIYDRELNTYQLNEVHGEFELPGFWFSAAEATSLLSFLQLIEHFDSSILHNMLEPLRLRLKKQLDVEILSIEDVLKRIRIISMNARRLEPQYFELVSYAVLAQKQVKLYFYNRQRDQAAWRHLSPQRLVHYRDNWYLDAFDHDKQALRTFSLDCINDIRILDEPATQIEDAVLNKELATAYGIFAGTPTQQAVLRFSPERARWVAGETWHTEQQGTFDDEGYYILSIPYRIEHELVMDILKHGANVEVLQPEGLRRLIQIQIESMADLYDK